MSSRFLASLTAVLLSANIAAAGESTVPRKQFTESPSYPQIFRPNGYLAAGRPVALRFSAAPPPCAQRTPPPLTLAAAKPEPKPEAAPIEQKPAPEQPQPPDDSTPAAPQPKPEAPDFSKVPDEVLEYFKNTEGQPVRRAYLFDPIFQPVQPHELPKSKATYQQK
jgi:hypothetical protein